MDDHINDSEEVLLEGPLMRPTEQSRSRVASARVSRRARSAAARRASLLAHETQQAQEELAQRISRKSVQQSRVNARVEEEWNVSTMEELKAAFFSTTDGVLNSEEFIASLRDYTKAKGAKSYLHDLFDKIDGANQGAITWDEFATYMLLEYQKKSDTYTRSKKVVLDMPARAGQYAVRSPCCALRLNNASQFIMLQDNGMLSFWGPDCSRIKSHQLDMESKRKTKSAWCTDACILDKLGLLVVASGERELWFFNFSTMEAIFVLTHLDDTPLCLDTTYLRHDHTTVLLVGDHQGCLVAIHMPDGFLEAEQFKNSLSRRKLYGETMRVSMDAVKVARPSYGNMFYTRWLVHNDWVSQIMYCEQLRMIISSCNDEETGLVVGEILQPALQEPRSYRIDPQGPSSQYFHHGTGLRRNQAQTVFRVRKGVRTLAYVPKGNLIATGGLDRAIWLWNPYVTFQAAGVLRGHTAPIHHICVSTTGDCRLYSLSVDYQLLVWDPTDMTCLASISRRRHKMTGDPTAMFYFPAATSLIVPAEHVYSIHIRNGHRRKDEIVSHQSPLVAAVFNARFRHLVTCSRDGTIKVWTIEGDQVFEFSVCDEGEAIDPGKALTAVTFDSSMRRLITAQVSGEIKAWNYGNGQLLRHFNKGTDKEVTSVVYLEHGMLRRIAATGWDRRIFMFKDLPEDDLHMAPVHPLPSRSKVQHHSDDVQALCFCPPNTLATSSYDGEVKAWNVTSMSVTATMTIPPPEPPRRRSQRRLTSSSPRVEEMMQERNLPHLLCLETRATAADVGTLVTCGGCGSIYFFTLAHGGRLVAWFSVDSDKDVTITRVKATKCNRFLIAADSHGFVRVFDISRYANGGVQTLVEDDAEDMQAIPEEEGPSISRRASEDVGLSASTSSTITITREPATAWPARDKDSSSPGVSPPHTRSPTNNLLQPGDAAVTEAARTARANARRQVTRTLTRNNSVIVPPTFSRDDFLPRDAGPPLVAMWRAHLDAVTGLELIEDSSLIGGDAQGVIISTSKDQRCRAWGFGGEFIGTFGQDFTWDLLSRDTWEHPERPPEIVKYEETELKKKREEEALKKEMAELGIYDDEDSDNDSGDDDDLRAQTPYDTRLKFGLGSTRATSRRRSVAQQRQASHSRSRGVSAQGRASSSARTLTRATTGTALQQRLSEVRAGPRLERQTSDSIFDLRNTPNQSWMPMQPPKRDGGRRQQSHVVKGRARKQSMQRSLARESSAVAFQRLAGRPSGNWERHIRSLPHRLPSRQVYLCLPYHGLNKVNAPEKPQYQDDTSFLVEQMKR
ncbi:hypothetical protein PTSG_00359 [Salpingoeca rosetta]|uniref:EF-hand domain-containing protein n=1 Tax=Salpingoeca rosetta (strain ATCC 50818 / BSB-021) TaxID=946362 RepID=F2TW92_SALR5|nr:uncharacterized protein PTSG_00359 [Salpingoeca rosetta]EGD72338.1 hypothetical protein PTSG_00359 [Salpingoeca rosetta]|eukprot:XP_004998908.1 hypothetical protein PTSG_00359 [Salpingoeca rosetta]